MKLNKDQLIEIAAGISLDKTRSIMKINQS